MLIAPATSPAATDFGSNLISAADISVGCGYPGCTQWNATLNAANTKGTVSAPFSGVVVSFTLKKAANPGSWSPLRLRAVRPLGDVTYPIWRGLGKSTPDVTPTNTAGLQTFPVRLSMEKGDFLGFEQDGSSNAFSGASTGFGAAYRVATPALPYDSSPPGTSVNGGELLLQARIEPDKDGDGFGDETQDGCPTDPKTHGACATKKKCKKKQRKSAAAGAAKKKKKKCRKRKRK